MLVLVANLGSTSFKYKLYDLPSERVRAVGASERIGQESGGAGAWSIKTGQRTTKSQATLADHRAAIDLHLSQLLKLGVLASLAEIDAVGFKAVHGGPIGATSGSGAVPVDDQVLATMQAFADVAPAHNPPYIAAMKAFAAKLPGVPQVAAFETAFHQTIPLARQVYGIPWEWTEKLGIRRYGFHGASHRYIATRMAQLAPHARRVISLHLGGSSSICAIAGGKSVATSMGMTPQSGPFQNNRVGDFDTFALQKLVKADLDLPTILRRLSTEGGWLGISGVSADVRDVQAAAAGGNTRAQLALDAFVEACRHYVGAYLAVLGGADAVAFTGGIGQHQSALRRAILANMDYAGIRIDEQKNRTAAPDGETRIDAAGPAPASKTQVWVLPTNEELVVARQTAAVLATQHA